MINPELVLIGKSKKRILTLNSGEYTGFVQRGRCYVYGTETDNKKPTEKLIVHSFDTDILQKNNKVIDVTVIVNIPNAKIYIK